MVLTLATNYDSLRGVLAFPAAVLMFLVAVFVALVISKRRGSEAWWMVVGWGVLYPVAQVFASGLAGSRDQVWLQSAIPTVVSALLLWWASRSRVPVVGCLLGWAATSAVGPMLVRNNEEWYLAVPWNVCAGASLVVWAWWVRGSARREGVCPRCEYGVRGLSGKICPECGPRRVGPEGTCGRCGYDVSRVRGGVCPECGAVVRPAPVK